MRIIRVLFPYCYSLESLLLYVAVITAGFLAQPMPVPPRRYYPKVRPLSWLPPLLCAPAEEGEYFLKVLIPSYAAGSIIGRGGQTIVQLQEEAGSHHQALQVQRLLSGVSPNPGAHLLRPPIPPIWALQEVGKAPLGAVSGRGPLLLP